MFEAFARPVLLLLAPLIYWLLRAAFRQFQSSQWQSILPEGLAQRLLSQQGSSGSSARWPAWSLAALITCLLSLALAGVGFPVQVKEAQRQQQEVVIIQRLAPPERGQTDSVQLLQTAQQLLVPFLNNRKQGQTALILYAGSAHLASPMTSDSSALRQIIGLAHPSVMPRRGDQPREAWKLAAQTGQLGQQTSAASYPLYWVWVTDRLPPHHELQQLLDLKPPKAEVAVILTASSATSEDQVRAVKDLGIAVMTPQEASSYLDQLNRPEGPAGRSETFNQPFFQELGHWLLLPALLLLLWHYLGQPWPKTSRHHLMAWLLFGVLIPGLLTSMPAQASSWQNKDYQAWQALMDQQPELSLMKTSQPRLLGEAWFQLEDFVQAALAYELALEQPPTDTQRLKDLLFNAGTAWLFSGDFNRALPRFDQVRELAPERKDNCINRALALRLKEGKPLPSKEELKQACGSGQHLDEEEVPEKNRAEQAPSWQPRKRSPCVDCLPLDPEQEQTLEQLEEDPWRLLRNRFQYELRERDS